MSEKPDKEQIDNIAAGFRRFTHQQICALQAENLRLSTRIGKLCAALADIRRQRNMLQGFKDNWIRCNAERTALKEEIVIIRRAYERLQAKL